MSEWQEGDLDAWPVSRPSGSDTRVLAYMVPSPLASSDDIARDHDRLEQYAKKLGLVIDAVFINVDAKYPNGALTSMAVHAHISRQSIDPDDYWDYTIVIVPSVEHLGVGDDPLDQQRAQERLKRETGCRLVFVTPPSPDHLLPGAPPAPPSPPLAEPRCSHWRPRLRK